MSSQPTSFDADGVIPAQRLEVLLEELSELAGQRNAIDGRIVDIVAELERDELWCHGCPLDHGVGGLENRCHAA
jgi:hypothetical protein